MKKAYAPFALPTTVIVSCCHVVIQYAQSVPSNVSQTIQIVRSAERKTPEHKDMCPTSKNVFGIEKVVVKRF